MLNIDKILEAAILSLQKEGFNPNEVPADEGLKTDSQPHAVKDASKKHIQDASVNKPKPAKKDRAEIIQAYSKIAEKIDSVLAEKSPRSEKSIPTRERKGKYAYSQFK